MSYKKIKNNKWVQYVKIRFPILPLVFFTFLVATSSENILLGRVDFKALLVGILFLLFFFHLRLLDEFKDFEYDSKFHKERPVQSGVIALSDIKIAVIINLGFMVVLSSLMGNMAVFLLTMFYTLLMFKEFFIEKFYDRFPSLYLISHEIVFIPLYIFLFSYYYAGTYLSLNYQTILIIMYFIVPVTLIEIGRKMTHRYDQRGKLTTDTYVFIWGEKKTIAVFMVLCAINSVAFSLLAAHLFGYIMGIGFLSLARIATTQKKVQNLITRNNMTVTTFCALLFPLLLLLI